MFIATADGQNPRDDYNSEEGDKEDQFYLEQKHVSCTV